MYIKLTPYGENAINQGILNDNLIEIFPTLFNICYGSPQNINVDEIINEIENCSEITVSPLYPTDLNIVIIPPFRFKVSGVSDFPNLCKSAFICSTNGNLIAAASFSEDVFRFLIDVKIISILNKIIKIFSPIELRTISFNELLMDDHYLRNIDHSLYGILNVADLLVGSVVAYVEV